MTSNTALIVTFNRLNKLKKCLQATLPLPFQHIVIVDNASCDGTKDWLNTLNDPRLCILSLPENTGGSGGFKYGANYIVAQLTTDWVFFYDDDAYPDNNLLQYFSVIKNNHYQVYCCKVVDRHGQVCKMNLPYKHLPQTFLQSIHYLINSAKFVPNNHHSQPVVTCSFVGAIFRADIIANHLDYLFQELFIYYDDLYFSYQLTQQGYLIRYSPELLYYHDIDSLNIHSMPRWKVYYLVRNLLLSIHLFSWRQKPYSMWAIMLRLVKMIWGVVHQEYKLAYLAIIWRGVIDGLVKKTGMLR